MDRRFLGKIVVIVGGNSGIGLATSKAFAAEGARVVITGRNTETLKAAAIEIGASAEAYQCDIGDLKQISSLFNYVKDAYKHIDVLFVNAGIGLYSPVETATEADWDLVQHINLKGVFFTIQAALPLMLNRSASIVITGSIAARIAAPTRSIYSASKAGVRALARTFAAELIDRDIRVNVVSPGFIESPMHERIVGLDPGGFAARRQQMLSATPMKRFGTPGDVAAAVLFLSSAEAAFVTGVDFLVDGGTVSL